MELVRIRASPKQLSRLRNGHKVSVKPAVSGEGINLLIDPSQYDPITRSFAKGKGKVVQLSPEEIMANREVEGSGIFDTIKKGAKSLAKSKIGKSLAKTAIDTAVASAGASGYVPPSVAKALGKEAKSQVDGYGLMDTLKKGAKSLAKSKVGKSLAKTAIDTAVASAGASGYVPPSVAKALGKEAKSQVDGYGIMDTLKKGAKSLAKSKIGKSLAKTAIDTAVASAGASGYVPPSVAKALGKEAKSQVDGYGIWSGGGGSQGRGMCPSCGCGLTAGNGLYAGRARGMGMGMSGGALLGVHNGNLPPALQSQNLSANFAFRNQLPPALAQMK
jgi:hypothetical protein